MSRARKQINEVAWPGVLIAECLAVMEGEEMEGTAAKTLKSGVGCARTGLRRIKEVDRCLSGETSG